MNNYLNDVRKHLLGIPEEDVSDLMEYYEEYFYDAGVTDAQAYSRYGKPKNFAKYLKVTYFMNQDDEALLKAKPKSRLRLVWMIVLGLFASPILVPLAFAAAVTIFALLFAFAVIVLSAYVVVISLIAAGIVGIFFGVAALFQSPATAFIALGSALLALGIGLILAPFLIKFTRLLFNLFMKFVKWVGRKFTGRSKYAVKGGMS
ncbi:MAG: DUF1700 domain-containing protein [Streptococcaceae bacterium]|jgi:uncharacterized membrane protein|nr:DUF1700 domain-containing protein [Streptococcaceae bacterium]